MSVSIEALLAKLEHRIERLEEEIAGKQRPSLPKGYVAYRGFAIHKWIGGEEAERLYSFLDSLIARYGKSNNLDPLYIQRLTAKERDQMERWALLMKAMEEHDDEMIAFYRTQEIIPPHNLRTA